jgi:hypothetical protein
MADVDEYYLSTKSDIFKPRRAARKVARELKRKPHSFPAKVPVAIGSKQDRMTGEIQTAAGHLCSTARKVEKIGRHSLMARLHPEGGVTLIIRSEAAFHALRRRAEEVERHAQEAKSKRRAKEAAKPVLSLAL